MPRIIRHCGRVVRRRSAKPLTSVQFCGGGRKVRRRSAKPVMRLQNSPVAPFVIWRYECYTERMRDLKLKARRAKEQRERLRAEWFSSMGGRCLHCGSKENLEVDHIDRSTKRHHAIWSWAEQRRIEELKKCQPLCRSCHKKKTISEFIKHGISRYRAGCRCETCKDAKSKSNAKRKMVNGKRIYVNT